MTRMSWMGRIAAVCGGLALMACGGGGGGGGSPADDNAKVSITVQGPQPPTNAQQQQAYDSYMQQLNDFGKEHPNVKLTPQYWKWDPQTFSAKLSSGQITADYTTSFTDPAQIIPNHQAADITDLIKQWKYYKDLNPHQMKVAESNGRIYGVAGNGYNMGLFYNRELFQKAGLNPDDPPMTWDDVRKDAKAIAKLGGGVVGFAFPTQQNTGGWYLTTLVYSHGGRMEKRKSDGTWAASFNDQKGVDALKWLMAMRWQDDSMGSNMMATRDELNQLFATGKVGLYINAIDMVGTLKNTFNFDLNNLGVSQLPQNGGNATLAGGSITMFNPKLTRAELKAAVEWYQFRNTPDLKKQEVNDQLAIAQGKAVGVPTGASQWAGQVARDMEQVDGKYRNVPLQNFKGYDEGTKRLANLAEPPASAQQLYHFLDGVIQVVLTQRDSDPKQQLDQAARQVDVILAAQ